MEKVIPKISLFAYKNYPVDYKKKYAKHAGQKLQMRYKNFKQTTNVKCKVRKTTKGDLLM